MTEILILKERVKNAIQVGESDYLLKITEHMREIGEGIKRIFTEMHAINRPKPILYSNTTWFTVTLMKD
jgi:predicted HTH transcriptional regulator